MTRTARILAGCGLVIALALIAYIALWLWLLSARDTLSHPLAEIPIFPVACSTRGCVTSANWNTRHRLSTNFATATGQDAPSVDQSLTNTVRTHLIQHAFLKSPVTLVDARRYREEVLYIKNNDQLEQAVGVGTTTYDAAILMPFLQQEALKLQHKVESTEELYTLLSGERTIVLLPFHFQWDKQTGQALPR